MYPLVILSHPIHIANFITVSEDLVKDKSVTAYIRMFELGDFFDLEGLRKQAVDKLESALYRVALSVNKKLKEEDDLSTISPEQFINFTQVVQVAYSTDSATYQALKEAVMTFFSLTAMQPFKLSQFSEFLGKVPNLAVDIITALANEHSPIGDSLLKSIPSHCSECNKLLETYEGLRTAYLVSEPQRTDAKFESVCPDC